MTQQQDIDEKIQLVPFNPQWKEIYKSETDYLKNQLGSEMIDIQHIGSTAVPAIYSKPIIDMMIGIDNLENSGLITQKLVEFGYQYFGEANVPGRLYFRKRNKYNFNIALCQYQGDIWTNNILFRNYLLKHPEAAEAYSTFKKNAFDSGADTLLKYSTMKHTFIDEMIRNARKAGERHE